MKIIELDAAKWANITDFYDAILAAIGAPKEHGKNIAALIDSMIWGGMNAVSPPYIIEIRNTKKLPKELFEHIELVKASLSEARESRGHKDVNVSVNIVS